MIIRATSITVVFFLTLIGAIHSGVDPTLENPWGLRESIQWKSAKGGSAEALAITEYSSDRAITRMLVEAPNGQRLVLTYKVFPTKGESLARVQSEDSDWFVQLRKKSGVKLDSMADYFQPASFAEKFREGDGRIFLTFESARTDPFEMIASEWNDQHVSRFYNGLQEGGRLESLVQAVDLESREALRFLWAASRPNDCHGGLLPFSQLAELVVKVLDAESSHPSENKQEIEKWTPETLGLTKGTSLEAEQELGFAKRFPSVVATAPLFGYHDEEELESPQ